MQNSKIWIAVLAILILISSFYWFQLRPIQIRKECNKYASSGQIEDKSKSLSLDQYQSIQIIYNNFYAKCLREKGLEK